MNLVFQGPHGNRGFPGPDGIPGAKVSQSYE